MEPQKILNSQSNHDKPKLEAPQFLISNYIKKL